MAETGKFVFWTGKFVFSFNEERFGSDEYETRAEALAAARDEEPEDACWTGKVVALKLSDGFRSEYWLWDSISEEFFEQVGEVAELPNPSKEAWDDFRVMLDAWATKYGLHPGFFRVDDIEGHSP